MDNLKNKRILVTGGNGYLGSFLVDALKSLGCEIFILDQKQVGNSNEFGVDITIRNEVYNLLTKIKPHIVFHLAALLERGRDFSVHEKSLNVNYIGTMNLLLALKDIPEFEHFIFTSTSEVYGTNPSPFTEDMPPKPVSPYSMTKVFAEVAIQSVALNYGLNYTILRLFNFFGENMPPNFFIPQMLNAFKYEEVFKMTNGEQARDFLYVGDIINALLLTATNPKSKQQIFNVCSAKSITLKDFVTLCHKSLQSTCRIDFGALPYRENEIWNMVGDNTKIRQTLGFEVQYDISTIIQKI
ncbi:MAG TPA: NAD(P)-dependent oxidoreductase [Bacteroidales bacterium]|jgi:UDP-glucose 4-epimerase|nr:NAD(P)-dependent oxidoreductase [Bacteroidales bacterium]